MPNITESEFAKIVDGIAADRDSIIRHNPIGTPEETLLWMVMSSLVVYLSLEEIESPWFPGIPDAKAYKEAIRFILAGRMEPPFDPDRWLATLEPLEK